MKRGPGFHLYIGNYFFPHHFEVWVSEKGGMDVGGGRGAAEFHLNFYVTLSDV